MNYAIIESLYSLYTIYWYVYKHIVVWIAVLVVLIVEVLRTHSYTCFFYLY